MLTKFFLHLTKFPNFKKRFWKGAYNFLAKAYPVDNWRFMNYGYAPTNDPKFANLSATDELDRYAIQMYHKAIFDGDWLKGKVILEVGCGRGGGSEYLHRTFQSSKMTGLDIAEKAIDFCKTTYQSEGLDYVAGSADDLPFAENQFDAVVNVESSHTYPDVKQFLMEVARVLKPKGRLLFVDFRKKIDMPVLHRLVQESAMTILHQENITRSVVNALRLDNDYKNERINTMVNPIIRPFFKQFAGMEDSTIFKNFESGKHEYWAFMLEKE